MQSNPPAVRPSFLTRVAVLSAGVLAYVGFHAAFLAMISFLNGGPLPFARAEETALAIPLAIGANWALVALFGLQHAVMARPEFKERWTRVVPPVLERSIFVVATVAVLFAAIVFWQSVPGTLFSLEEISIRITLYVLQGLGWGVVVLSTFLIDHFELFGLRQVWCAFRGTSLVTQEFRKPFLYRYSRHPMMVGLLLGFWATPDMTIDRFVWALGFSVYIVLGVRLEERDLVTQIGDAYREYQEEVPRFLGLRRSHAVSAANGSAGDIATNQAA